ncbi:MAG: PIN domain-containing protein [Thermoleophilia bacterium]|nr:PIN domain-containing protein [Thermoleophilia bacterium]
MTPADPDFPHEVLIDTSALYALLDEGDVSHEPARALAETLFARDTVLVATSSIVVEAAALLQARLGRPAARRFLLDLVPYLDIAWVEADLYARSVEAWLAEDRRDVSLVDCMSFALMHELHIEHAFTFDRHFADGGFTILPRL